MNFKGNANFILVFCTCTLMVFEWHLIENIHACFSVCPIEFSLLFFFHDNLSVRVCVAQERDTERQRVDELLEMNIHLEADLRHTESVPSAIHHRFLQSELDSDEELGELIG